MRRPAVIQAVVGSILISVWALALGAGFARAETVPPTNEKMIGTALDFVSAPVGSYQKGYVDFSRWTEDRRRQAEASSRMEIVEDPATGKKALRVQIRDADLLSDAAIPLLRIASFFPPEADVVRVHVRVVSGRLRMYLGGPTAYYANSDVFTETKELVAAGDPVRGMLDFNLHHPLYRNFRRAGFSTDAKRIYYNRWAQEPTGLYVALGTVGEFLIERIDLVSRGEGRPFATFPSEEVQTVRAAFDIETGRKEDVFNLYMADGETEWFEASWKRERPLRFNPAKIQIVQDVAREKKTLVCLGPSAEEVQCVGVRTKGEPKADALRFTLFHDAAGYRNTVVGAGRAEAVDFLVFVAPSGKPFPWHELEPSAELRGFPGPGFDYQMSYRAIRNRADLDFAIYQTRRFVRPQEWTTLVLPESDFVCIYGSGAYRDRFLRSAPMACGDVMAVAWLNPWCRAGRGDVQIRLDEIAFVRTPAPPTPPRSYWQIDPRTTVQWIDEKTGRGPIRHMLLPGDERPVADETSRAR